MLSSWTWKRNMSWRDCWSQSLDCNKGI
jgi:hypothetical protein